MSGPEPRKRSRRAIPRVDQAVGPWRDVMDCRFMGPFGPMDDKDRAVGVCNAGRANGAEQQSAEAPMPSSAHDEHGGVARGVNQGCPCRSADQAPHHIGRLPGPERLDH